MPTIQDLIPQVRQAFTDTGGLLPNADMYSRFVNECQVLDIDEKAFYAQVLKPATKGLDLDEIERNFREKQAAEAIRKAEEDAIRKAEEDARNAAQTQAIIDDLVNTAFANNIIKASDLRQIFNLADLYLHNTDNLADSVVKKLLSNDFRPQQSIDTNKLTVKEKLLSTDWLKKDFTNSNNSYPNLRTVPSDQEVPKANKKVLRKTIFAIIIIILFLRYC